ncbi:MAG: hypothetical protein EZS28_011138 [Streblomastix strix]|uniref:Uncharacterized protein n=1 Tax=Streblomastix strix TaxID=222440 RepID=A0A5J4WEE2_9EUKA|nr:MAG: hypothetical protein EZS28_011138 [Streblomastix strix]
MNANQDHSKNARQFNGLGTLQTHTQGTNSSHAVDLPVAQLDLDVFQSERQLAPTVATNALIQRTTPLPLVQGQLVQILEGITGVPLQETDFYATNMSNTQVLEVMQRAARAPQLLQPTEIPAADRQLLPPLWTIDALASGFQLQALQFWELGILTIQHILEGNLTEAVIDTVSGLVLALRQAERANTTRIKLFSGINAHLFDGNNNPMMSNANLATTQRQIGIQQLTSGQNVANVQGNLIGANAFLNLQPPQRRAMLTPAQITNNLLLAINTKQEQQTQQSQIIQAPSQGPFQAQFQQNLQSQQQSLSLNRGLFNTATQLQLNQQNSGLPDLSVNRLQQIAPIIPIIQNSQQQGADSEDSQTQRRNTIARNSNTVMEIDIESEGREINHTPLEAKINRTSFNRQRDYWATKSYLLKYTGKPGAGRHHPRYGEGLIEVQEVLQRHARGETISIADWRKFWKELDTDLKLDIVRLQSPLSESEEKDQSTGFWNNPRKRYRQVDRSNSGGNNQNSQPRYNTRDDFRSQGRGQRGGRGDYRGRGYRGNRGGRFRDDQASDTYNNGNRNLFSVAPWPPVEPVPATTSNTVVHDLTQRQIGAPVPQLVRTPDSWKSNKTPTPKQQQSKQPTPTQATTGQLQPTIQQQITIHPLPQVYQLSSLPSLSTSQSSETTSSNIIPIPTPSVHQVQQEQEHLFHPPVAVSPPPINATYIKLPPVVEVLPDNTTQPINNILIPQQHPQNQQQLVNQQQQLFNLQVNSSLTNNTDFQMLLTLGRA